jgi:Uma2 family endonuclease
LSLPIGLWRQVLDVDARLITLDEYHRMVEARIFGEDDRLELLEGVIARTSAQSPEHARVIWWLNNTLARLLPPSLCVGPQLPLTVSSSSEPEPDLSVVEAGWPADEHPRSARLVVEVSAGFLRQDRGVKAAIYARAGIPEYWIVNLADRCVEVHRDPDVGAGRYRTLLTFADGQALDCASVPEIRLTVGQWLTS